MLTGYDIWLTGYDIMHSPSVQRHDEEGGGLIIACTAMRSL